MSYWKPCGVVEHNSPCIWVRFEINHFIFYDNFWNVKPFHPSIIGCFNWWTFCWGRKKNQHVWRWGIYKRVFTSIGYWGIVFVSKGGYTSINVCKFTCLVEDPWRSVSKCILAKQVFGIPRFQIKAQRVFSQVDVLTTLKRCCLQVQNSN